MGKINISKSVKSIDFGKQYGVRVQRIFEANCIISIRDLCLQARHELCKIRYLNKKSISIIEATLEKYGLRIDMTDKELDEYAGIVSQETPMSSCSSEQDKAESEKWEARRYELAKEFFIRNNMDAYRAVTEADNLIRFLRKIPGNS